MKKTLQNLRRTFFYDELIDGLSKKLIPDTKSTFWYFFGGLTLFFVGIQFISGFLLLIYYSPTPNSAYESVSSIIHTVPYGWLVRSIHVWSANLLMVSLFIHFGAGFFMRAYISPRESVWLTGVLLLFIVLGFGFTGSLLPWDMRAYFATQIGTEIPRSTPLLGPIVVRLLRGADLIGGESLKRLFALHISILPFILLCIMSIHLILNHKHGPSVLKAKSIGSIKQVPFYPDFLSRDLFVWTIACTILIVISLLIPVGIGSKADPYISAPAGIKPEWYFYPLYMTLRLLPGRLLGLNSEMLINCCVALLGFVLLGLPFMMTGQNEQVSRKIYRYAGVVLIGYLSIMTILGFIF